MIRRLILRLPEGSLIRRLLMPLSIWFGCRQQRRRSLVYSQGSHKGHQTARTRRMERHVRVWGADALAPAFGTALSPCGSSPQAVSPLRASIAGAEQNHQGESK